MFRTAILSCLMALASAGVAQAEVRSITVPVEYGEPAPSLDPDPADDPANQNLLRQWTVAYDKEAGSVSVVGVYNREAAGRENDLPHAFRLGCTDDVAITVVVMDESYGGTPWATARLTGFEGYVEAGVAFNGNTESTTLSHPEFRGIDFRCVRVQQSWAANGFGSERHYFAGYSPADIAGRQPTHVTVGPYKWRESEPLFLVHKPRRFGLWGNSNAQSGRFLQFRWSKWGRDVAVGRGYAKALHGRLKRGRLVFDNYRVTMTFYDTRLCGEVYEFTRVKIKSRFGTGRMKIPNAC
jgi:hypothetical protein